MPRVNIYFTDDTLKELKEYLNTKYGRHKALSLIVQLAVKEFLEREKTQTKNLQRGKDGN